MAVSDSLADRTWPVEAGGKTYVVVGPDYVGDASLVSGKLRLQTESPWNLTGDAGTVAYGESDAPIRLTTTPLPSPQAPVPALTRWDFLPADTQAATGFDDASWMVSPNPRDMAADGNVTCYAWYRSTVSAPTAGPYSLVFSTVGDMMELFVDGQRLPGGAGGETSYPLTLTPGKHTLAAFTEHFGRDKLFNHLGPIDTSDPKGLSGPVSLVQTGGAPTTMTDWRVLMASGRLNDSSPQPAEDAPGWATLKTGERFPQCGGGSLVSDHAAGGNRRKRHSSSGRHWRPRHPVS